jgi:hypothetical protein
MPGNPPADHSHKDLSVPLSRSNLATFMDFFLFQEHDRLISAGYCAYSINLYLPPGQKFLYRKCCVVMQNPFVCPTALCSFDECADENVSKLQNYKH